MACERGHTHLIVFTHACGDYSRAATISLAELQLQLLFEGGYYSGCGFYSNKYGICCSNYSATCKFTLVSLHVRIRRGNREREAGSRD